MEGLGRSTTTQPISSEEQNGEDWDGSQKYEESAQRNHYVAAFYDEHEGRKYCTGYCLNYSCQTSLPKKKERVGYGHKPEDDKEDAERLMKSTFVCSDGKSIYGDGRKRYARTKQGCGQ
ncbi:hypothetical protein [Piscinibacter gummiphilus]|uniref:Uncharacterized protein n=1 Tax=Piscinibacter gummiphilus TaxID=946333 RepID=A0ABZ0CVF1_9BURK|nr:hypothetical protein [Piscinibacter gummiphilus]WOB06927.1 hypothetical protein RXV79_18615 [Piscinibacter gummiphilus]